MDPPTVSEEGGFITPQYQSIDHSNDEVPRWDMFKLPPQRVKSQKDESLIYVIPLKIMRFLCFIVVFAVVLGSSVLSKLTLTLMSSQTVINRTMDLAVETTNKRFIIHTGALERMGWSWCILFTLLVPEILTFLTCLWTVIFKSHSETLEKNDTPYLLRDRDVEKEKRKAKEANTATIWLVFFSETLHMLGINLLVFVVFPNLDSVKSIMFMNALCVVPCLMLLVSRLPIENKFQSYLKLGMDLTCFGLLFGGLIIWTYVNRAWFIVVVALLISCGWWENFLNEDSNQIFIQKLAVYRKVLKTQNKRYFVYLYISVWKMVICFAVFFINLAVTMETDLLNFLPYFSESFQSQPVALVQTWQTSKSAVQGSQGDPLESFGLLPVYIMLINMGCAYICYLFAVFACKICIQEFSFSLPLSLSIPISIFLTSSACSWRMENHAFLTNIFPKYVYWTCPQEDFVDSFLGEEFGWVWILWFVSQAWITVHVWSPLNIRKASTDRLFVNPMYCGAIIDQSLLLNRRKHKKPKLIERNNQDSIETGIQGNEEIYATVENKKKDRSNTTVYACATMWHENKEEMIEMLKSVMRVDKYLAYERHEGDERQAYNFEVHILFDDAFKEKEEKISSNQKEQPKPKVIANKYVKDLISVMEKAASKIYPKDVRTILHPRRTVTAYGGRLVWFLPGGTPMVVHLKDKDKIRHKKRWSQVMYMYYLLGFLFMDEENDEWREETEDNTFILALDGDIDFKADAITRLLDLMDEPTLGAACGRIHPVGAGPIAWYQKFEYAIGHWLQKATEHVTGCVLCSPGCFSLFRGKAIMEVMRTYATVAEEALHYVQYDQGEDRWLCTLILKRGYRIEYSAASDAYTHCPESFGEFYTQRRRWGPSTMANILDLLKDYKATVQINNSISTPYIAYQGMMMAGTILGPGTIFLMVVGAMVAALRISNMISMACNVVPLITFILICFLAKNEIQIMFAMILSSAYALLMVAVLVGTAIQLNEDGVSSPSGMFLVALSSSFVISALLHPQEFFCVAHGFLYFLMVPSMYLLLNLYSLINLNVVSWGTREDPSKKDEEAAAKLKLAEEEAKKKSGGAINSVSEWLGLENQESFLSKFCQCFFCSYQKDDKKTEQLLVQSSETLEELNKKITLIELKTDAVCESLSPQGKHSPTKKHFDHNSLSTISEGASEDVPVTPPTNQPVKQKVKTTKPKPNSSIAKRTLDYDKDPYWIKEAPFKSFDNLTMPEKEDTFWVNMINKYLLPLEKSVETETRVARELIELRNRVCFGFFMINALFILIVFLLQLNKDTLYLNWPVNAKCNISYIPESNRIQIDWDYLQLEPIGLVFALFFGIILLFQFFGMLAHRFGTFEHIMADTTLSCNLRKSEEFVNDFDEDMSDEEDEEYEDDLEMPDGEVDPSAPNAGQMRRGSALSYRNRSNSVRSRGSMGPRNSMKVNPALLKQTMQLNPGERKVSMFLIEDQKVKPKFETIEEQINHRKSIKNRRKTLANAGAGSPPGSLGAAGIARRKSRLTDHIFKVGQDGKDAGHPPQSPPPNGTVPNMVRLTRESTGFDNRGFTEDEDEVL